MVAELRASTYVKGRGQCDIRNLNLHSESWVAIKAAITAGLYPNIARYCPLNGSIFTREDMKSQFHYASTLLAQETKTNHLGGAELSGVPSQVFFQPPVNSNNYRPFFSRCNQSSSPRIL